MQISLELPDELFERLTSAGMMSEDAIVQLLHDAMENSTQAGLRRNSAYDTLFEQTHDAVFMIGLDGRQLAANRRAVELTGYPLEELLDLSFRELSADVSDSQQVLHKLIRGIKMPPYERVFRTRAGQEFTAEVSAELVRDARGAPLYIQSVVRDITKRKNTEKALQDSALLLRRIIDLVPEHIFVKGRDGRYILGNKTVAETFGTTPELLEGKPDTDFQFSPEQAERYIRQDQQVIDSGEVLIVPEEDFLAPDGSHRIFHVLKMPLMLPDRDEQAVLGIISDITGRKQAEKTLSDSARMLREIIDLVPHHIYAKDRDGRYVLANKSMAALYQTTPQEMIGKTDLDFTPLPVDATRYTSQDRHVIETGEWIYRNEEEFTDLSGGQRFYRTVKIPLMLPDRKEPVALGVSTDITDLRQAANELRQAYRQAFDLAAERQRVQILTQFIQDSSHEFRTPLSVISTSLYLMTRTTDTERIATHAAQADMQIEQITHLLDQLQTMADLDSGIPFDFVLVNLNRLLTEVCNPLAAAASTRGMSFVFDFSADLPLVHGDLLRLRQAFVHLLDNAARFTPDNGSIFVSTALAGDSVVISIRDTGIGIPPEMLEYATRRFWRHDKAHSTPGFGLGLPIVQKIVERHKGKFQLDSLAQVGTTVTIMLPNPSYKGFIHAPDDPAFA